MPFDLKVIQADSMTSRFTEWQKNMATIFVWHQHIICLIQCFDGSYVSVQRHDVIGIKLLRTFLLHVEYLCMIKNNISIAFYIWMELAWKPKERQL